MYSNCTEIVLAIYGTEMAHGILDVSKWTVSP